MINITERTLRSTTLLDSLKSEEPTSPVFKMTEKEVEEVLQDVSPPPVKRQKAFYIHMKEEDEGIPFEEYTRQLDDSMLLLGVLYVDKNGGLHTEI